MNKEMRIGVVNWDCSLPPDTFFGSYFSKAMSPKKWRTRTPYYADILAQDSVCCHARTAEEYDRELQYAIDAGIDYFAYVWHTDNRNAKPVDGVTTSITHPHAWTQDQFRKHHQKSALADKIKLCAIWMPSQPYNEEDYRRLAEAMNAPFYETVDGRPLVYVFGGYLPEVFERLRTLPEKYGTADPYIVFQNNGAEPVDGDCGKADAVSAYACGVVTDTDRFSQMVDIMMEQNEDRKKYGLDTIPLFSLGWAPGPRVENPVPWTSYLDIRYHADATPAEIEEGAKRLADWIAQNPDCTKTGHIITFAWNEFEEGSWICPTYAADGGVNTERIEAFAACARMWKEI